MPPMPAPAIITTQITPTKVLGTIPYVASSQQTLSKLDRTMSIRSLSLRLTGSVTTTAASTAAAIGAGDEWGIVRLIEVVANGGNVLRSVTGEQLVILNYLLAGYVKESNTMFSGGAATYTFDSTLPLWFCLPGNLGKALDCTLAANLLSDLYLRVTWGTPGNINNINGATTVTNVQITVSADSSFFLDKRIVPAFAFTQLQQYTFTNIAPTGSGTAGYPWQIPVGQSYPFVLLNAKNTGTAVDNATALNGTLVIQSGTNQLYNADMKTERMMNNFRGNIPFPRFSDFLTNTGYNSFNGWTLLKFPKLRNLTESLNLVDYQNCTVYIQNAAAVNIDLTVIPLTVFPTKQITG